MEEGERTAPLLLALLGDVDALFRAATDERALEKGDSFERTLAFWAVLQGTIALEKARRIAPALPSARSVAMAAIAAMFEGWGADPALVRRATRLVESKGAKS
jgi:hypothetical protein